MTDLAPLLDSLSLLAREMRANTQAMQEQTHMIGALIDELIAGDDEEGEGEDEPTYLNG